jgi:sugar lactone lactonase YvrE
VTVVAEGLQNPRGIAFGPDGSLYVVEAGTAGDECVEVPEPPAFGDPTLCFGATGAITRVAEGVQEPIVTGLPSHETGGQITGAQDIAVGEDGQIVFTTGYAQDPAYRDELSTIAVMMGRLYAALPSGTLEPLADLAAHELATNPETAGGDHSNPFGVVIAADGYVVVDSAGNDLLHVASDGAISTLAVFPPQEVEGPDGAMVEMASVPTSVAIGPDGAYYVGEFTGFPFTPGAARIWRVVPGEEPEVYATGFTAVIDLAFDADGRLYVLEAVQNGLGAIDPSDPASLAGALIRVDPDGSRTVLDATTLIFPTSVAIAPDGAIYVTNNGIVPGQGQVLRIAP